MNSCDSVIFNIIVVNNISHSNIVVLSLYFTIVLTYYIYSVHKNNQVNYIYKTQTCCIASYKRHDIAELLLKLALHTNQPNHHINVLICIWV